MFLFFYGVLLGSVAEGPVRELISAIGPGRPASARGDLYAVPDPCGWYPVLVPGAGRVRGMVHEAGGVDVAALDRFEGVDPSDPMAGEYRREELTVETDDGETLAAFAYLWNRAPTPELAPIADGDFAGWLGLRGERSFTGR